LKYSTTLKTKVKQEAMKKGNLMERAALNKALRI
jgi:hypothetical protein